MHLGYPVYLLKASSFTSSLGCIVPHGPSLTDHITERKGGWRVFLLLKSIFLLEKKLYVLKMK